MKSKIFFAFETSLAVGTDKWAGYCKVRLVKVGVFGFVDWSKEWSGNDHAVHSFSNFFDFGFRLSKVFRKKSKLELLNLVY